MTSDEIRKKFLRFFEERGHAVVPSSSLIPTDPSVLLTTAGMQQFKPYFTGELDPMKDFGAKSTVSIQKSFRTSDIDEVGDETHDTFFEMLGNFSFGYKPGEPGSPKGGYFKKEAIQYAFQFITEVMGLPISYVTIFKGSDAVPKDEESRSIWKSLGITDVREEGMDDVFWGPTGSEGPCGPTTEIYCKNSAGKDVEIWNIVFNQYFFPGSREELLSGTSGKQLRPLATPGVDTGMGFERLAMISQNTTNIFATDLFSPIMDVVERLAPAVPLRVKRIFADHIRASVFLIADGVRPSNKDAGYILRRLLRRMLAYVVQYDVHGSLFREGFEAVNIIFREVYPEVRDARIVEVMEAEQAKFGRAIARGIGELKKYPKVGAKEAFYLYESFGLPYELIRELAPEATKELHIHDFEREFKAHQEISRAGKEAKFGGHGLYLKTGEVTVKDESELAKVTRLHTATHLMHAGLRAVLGLEVQQKGSDITVERTRFDFNFPRKVTPEELKKVEAWVNEVIKKDAKVEWIETTYEEAVRDGALGFFRQKYPPRVKVYTMHDAHSSEVYSKEFCGGPHVTHTGEVGEFKIIKEEAVGAGVRRIRGIVIP